MTNAGVACSDWEVEDLSLDAWISDLETVVDAAGLDRFALLGVSQGGAIALAYAVPILYGAYARRRMKRDVSPCEGGGRDVALADPRRLGPR